MKRILAVFLTLAMVLNIAPVGALAASDSDAASIQAVAETEESPSSALDEETVRAIASDPFLQGADSAPAEQQQAEVDTSDVSMTATSSFGQLLIDSMDAEQTNDADSKIVNVTVKGSTATVEYYNMSPACRLVVAIYTDDTEQEMVASGSELADFNLSGTTETTEIQLEGTIPSSFVAKAYMLSLPNFEPMCNAYTSSQYTSGMQELEQATTGDFDEARTIDLDGDATTNFAVVNEGVELLKPSDVNPGEDQVKQQDDASLTYVIENASSRIRSLQPGDILVYPQTEGGMLIVKVKDIQINGTTVTITGDEDLDIDDVFDVLKVEDNASTMDFTYEDGSAEGVTYAGTMMTPVDLGMENGKKDDEDKQISQKLEVKHAIGSLTITGGVYATLGYGIKVFKDGDQKYITTHLDTKLQGTISLTGKYNEPFGLGKLGYENHLLGIYAGIEPTVEVHADANVEFTFKADKYNGFEYSFTGVDLAGGTCTDTSKPAECELYTKAEGELYVGINLKPATYALWKVVSINMDARIGVTGTFKLQKADKEDSAKESLHTCDYCLAFNLTGSAELTVHMTVTFHILVVGDMTKKWDKELFKDNWNIGDAYYSVVHNEFGWGTCPYRTYRVKVSAGTKGAGASLSVVQKSDPVLSNKLDTNGEYCMFLDPGSYTVKIFVNEKEYKKDITVGSSAQTVEFTVDNTQPGDDKDPDIVGSGTCGDDLTWKLDADGTLTISGTGAMYDYGTGLLGDTERAPWLQNLGSESPVKKLKLSEGITHIGEYAFMASQFETLTLPDSVTSIGYYAFGSCKKLETVTMGDNVTEIEQMAFMKCTALNSIRLSNSLQNIEIFAFSGCEKLENITLPDSLSSIGTWAFQNCKSLTSITIPGGVVETGGTYGMAGNGLYSSIFEGCEKLETVVLQRGINRIPAMFKGCTALREIYLPDTLEVVEVDAFADCTALAKVVYSGTENKWKAIDIKSGNDPLTNAQRVCTADQETKENSGTCGQNLTWTLNDDGVLTVRGTGAMNDFTEVPWDTDKVQKVVVENGVTGIGAYAFFGCPNLTKVHLPGSLVWINECALAECPQLATVSLPDSLTKIGNSAFRNDSALLSVNLPDGLVTIEARAFEGCKNLQSAIVIPHNVTEIPKTAFYGCAKIPSVQLSDAVRSIGEYAFSRCDGMKQISIPESVVSIGKSAFKECSGLQKAVLPDSVTSIETDTFKRCYELSEVVLPKNLTTIGDAAFEDTAITAMELPDSVTSIGDHAFQQTKLKGTFKIPAGVTEIGTGVFQWCQDLTEVVLPTGITKIGAYAFYNTGITDFVIPDGITRIDDFTFYGAALKSIAIPASVTIIGENAFSGCWYLKDVYYAGTEDQWKSIILGTDNDKLSGATIHYNSASGGTTGGGGRFDLEDETEPVENSVTTGTAAEKGNAYCATFENAKAGSEYVVIVSRNKTINGDKLLYINQVTAQADGELSVPFRTTATAAEMQYVVACTRDNAEPDQPSDPGSKPSSGGGDGGGIAIILVGGVVLATAVAGVVLLMPVDVQGTVKLADQPVANATVQVLQGDNVAAQTTTDANGWFAVKVRRGSYTLRVMWTDAEGQPVTRTMDFQAPDTSLSIAA